MLKNSAAHQLFSKDCPGARRARPALARRPLFAFDLDGTITRCELLPRIAERAGLGGAIRALTKRTLSGELDFAASFRIRFNLLRDIPMGLVHESIASARLDPHIESFIKGRSEDCVIVTGNLDLWVSPLALRLPCPLMASRGLMLNGALRLVSILDKGDAALALERSGRSLVAIGESVGDVPMFKRAALGIAFAGVHRPVPAVLRLAAAVANNGEELCRLLSSL